MRGIKGWYSITPKQQCIWPPILGKNIYIERIRIITSKMSNITMGKYIDEQKSIY